MYVRLSKPLSSVKTHHVGIGEMRFRRSFYFSFSRWCWFLVRDAVFVVKALQNVAYWPTLVPFFLLFLPYHRTAELVHEVSMPGSGHKVSAMFRFVISCALCCVVLCCVVPCILDDTPHPSVYRGVSTGVRQEEGQHRISSCITLFQYSTFLLRCAPFFSCEKASTAPFPRRQ